MRKTERPDSQTSVQNSAAGRHRWKNCRPRNHFRSPQRCHRQMLRRRRYPQAQAPRQTKERQTAHAPVWQSRSTAIRIHRSPAHRRQITNRAVPKQTARIFHKLICLNHLHIARHFFAPVITQIKPHFLPRMKISYLGTVKSRYINKNVILRILPGNKTKTHFNVKIFHNTRIHRHDISPST